MGVPSRTSATTPALDQTFDFQIIPGKVRPFLRRLAEPHPQVLIIAPVDEPVGTPGADETAVLAGGCFWGVQGVFEHVKGVQRAVSGYAGGSGPTAHYDLVSTGTTGHAESVEITYDPSQITYGQLLRIYFSVVHDPTQLEQTGARCRNPIPVGHLRAE